MGFTLLYLSALVLIPFAALLYFAFLRGWWLNFTLPAGTLTANVMAVSLYRALVEEKEKRKIRGSFQQFVVYRPRIQRTPHER